MVNKNKYLHILILLLMIVSFSAACQPAATQAPAAEAPAAEAPAAEAPAAEAPALTGKPIKIIMPVSLTGSFAGIEGYNLNGATLAMEEINAAGGVNGRPIQLMIEDTKSTVDGCIAAYQKLMLENPDSPVVYVNLMSQFLTALDPYIREEGILIVSGGSIRSFTESGNPWAMRIRLNDKVKTATAVDYVVGEGAKKLAVMHDTSDYGVGGFENIKARAEELGMPDLIANIETFNDGDQDYRAQILAGAAINPDYFFIWGHPTETALIYKQIRELGFDTPIFGAGTPPSQPMWDLVGPEISEGARGIVEPMISTDASGRAGEFVVNYTKRFGVKPGDFAVNGYDVVQMVALAAAKVGTDDREAFRDAMLSLNYEGLVNKYECDEKGDCMWECPIGEVRDGKAYLYKMVKFPH